MIILCLIFDNDISEFKTPNTIMIFSNKYPNLAKLTGDRWRILRPIEEGLQNTTDIAKEICKEIGTLDERKYGKVRDDLCKWQYYWEEIRSS